jgi:hypothetical protein
MHEDHTSELNAKIKSWLEKQGYPLEMHLHNKFHADGNFKIRHGWYYQDVETSTSREIDIVCTHTDKYQYCEINFVIECKGTDKPWILFSSENAISDYNRILAFSILSKETYGAIFDRLIAESHNDINSTKNIPWLWKDGRVGYSLAQAFEGNSDAPYKGVLSAIKAALHLKNNSFWQDIRDRKFYAIFPAVVTSSPLFECFTNVEGEAELHEIDIGFLFFNQPIGDFSGTCITIVNEKGIDKFINDCNKIKLHLTDLLEPHIENEWQAFINKPNK